MFFNIGFRVYRFNYEKKKSARNPTVPTFPNRPFLSQKFPPKNEAPKHLPVSGFLLEKTSSPPGANRVRFLFVRSAVPTDGSLLKEKSGTEGVWIALGRGVPENKGDCDRLTPPH